MGLGDSGYYRRRIEQEYAAAENATCMDARGLHLDLAERYAAKLRLIGALSMDTPNSVPEAAGFAPPPSASGHSSRQPTS